MSKRAEAATGAPIYITMGEPAGIGPEIAVAAYKALVGRIGNRGLRLIGDADVFRACGEVPDEALIATAAHAHRVAGKPNVRDAAATIEAIEKSVLDALSG